MEEQPIGCEIKNERGIPCGDTASHLCGPWYACKKHAAQWDKEEKTPYSTTLDEHRAKNPS